MTTSVQMASPSVQTAPPPGMPSAPANAPADAEPHSAENAQAPPSGFHAEMERHWSENKSPRGGKSNGRGPSRDGKKEDDTNSVATAPAPAPDPKDRVILPLVIALPQTEASPAPAADSGKQELEPDPPGIKNAPVDDAAPEPLQAKADDPRPAEPKPTPLAFAARLLPPTTKATPTAAPQIKPEPAPAPEDAAQIRPRVPEKHPATPAIDLAPEHSDERQNGSPADRPAEAEVILPRIEETTPKEIAAAPKAQAPSAATVASKLDPVIEPAAAPPSSSHDIRVRVPDSGGGSTDVRFVDTGGEVRVSVRTRNWRRLCAAASTTLRTGWRLAESTPKSGGRRPPTHRLRRILDGRSGSAARASPIPAAEARAGMDRNGGASSATRTSRRRAGSKSWKRPLESGGTIDVCRCGVRFWTPRQGVETSLDTAR
jgi:hypothetical protein